MMRIIVSSGQRMPRFDQLIQDADHLFAETNLGYDASLSMYKKEHYAYTLILRALKAYHFEGDPTPAVLDNHKRSMEALREMLIPSTTSQEIKDGPRNRQPLGRTTTTRAVTTRGASARPTRGTKRAVSEPQKKASGKATAGYTTASGVFDDLKKLTGLLGKSFDDATIWRLITDDRCTCVSACSSWPNSRSNRNSEAYSCLPKKSRRAHRR